MITAHLPDLAEVTSTATACRLLGRSRATLYRRAAPPVLGPPAPRPSPPNALTEPERQRVLELLRSPEYCDLAPTQVWARLGHGSWRPASESVVVARPVAWG